MDREYKEIMGRLQFSDEAKERLANAVAQGVRDVGARSGAQAGAQVGAVRTWRDDCAGSRAEPAGSRADGAMPAQVDADRSPRRTGLRAVSTRWRVAAAAAAVVIAIGAGSAAYASGALVSVGAAFDDVFGGPPAKTEVAGAIGKPIGASASSNGITVSADAVIGDRNGYVLVYSVSRDDGAPFEGVEVLENGLLTLGFGEGGTAVDGALGGNGSSYFYDADPSDNAVQYVEQMTVESLGGSIAGRTARASFKDLVVYNDQGREVVATGEWRLKFEMAFEDTSVDLASGQSLQLDGMKATVDALSISPIALYVDYTVDRQMNWENQESGRMSETNARELARFLTLEVSIVLKDGTVIEVKDGGGGNANPSRDGQTRCIKNIMFENIVDLDQVAFVEVSGARVEMP